VFTGIVQALAPVVEVADEPNLRRLSIALGPLTDRLALGASVAINGVCLTVTGCGNGVAHFDVIRESLERSNLRDLVKGRRVNVERSMRHGDEIGGHIVSGHVTDVVTVVEIGGGTNERVATFEVDARWLRYLHYKGFVALDGASLTISAVEPARRRFAVSLIPETIARTTLGTVASGERVNLEIDRETQTIVETVERLFSDPAWRQRLALEEVASETSSAGRWTPM
jgi:riboflavin synthase